MPSAFKDIANRVAGTLNTTMDGSTTSLVLTAGHGANFPSPSANGYIITVENERMLVTGKSTDTLTVTRGYDGTVAAGHSAGVTVEQRMVASTITDIHTNVHRKLESIEGWVTSASQNPSIGTLPADVYVVAARLHVTQAFDSDGTDNIRCGYDAADDAVFADIDVSTTGVKSVTLNALTGYSATQRAIEAYYSNGGTEPTTGKALVIVEFYRVTTQP